MTGTISIAKQSNEKAFFKKSMINCSILGILSAVCLSAEANDAPVLEETTLPSLTFTTTATKTPTLVKNTIAQTTVIDEEQLQRYRGQSVLDVLRGQAGFYVQQFGGDGQASNFSLRGFDSKQVLVLIDGIRYGSVSTGGAALNLLPVDQIDRIEILHGSSGSSLYGSDAMGGVIQVFTKGQHANQSNVAVTLGAGTENSYKGQITGQLVNKNSTLSLSTGYENTDGINATKNAVGANRDKDGYDSKNASLIAKHNLNDNVEVGFTGLYSDSTTDYDSDIELPDGTNLAFTDTHADYKNGSIAGFVNYKMENLSANIKYGQSFDKSISYDGTTPNGGKFDNKQNQLNVQLGYKLPVGQIIGGYERLEQNLDVSDTSSYQVKDRNIDSEFIGYQLATNKHDAQLNLRHDKNSQFGSKNTYNIGGAYRILPNTRIGAAHSTGFRAPSMNDLYGYLAPRKYSWGDSTGYKGNPNLKAETSKNTEVFIENSNASQTTRLTAYQSKLKDGLFYQYNFTKPSTTINQAQAKIKGINLTSDWRVHNVLFGIDYDYQSTEDQNGKELSNHPNYKGLAYIGYQQPQFDIRTEVQTIGDTSLDGYTLLNLMGNYYINPNLTLSSRINNLTGKDYETYSGFNSKGINSFVSLTYQWF